MNTYDSTIRPTLPAYWAAYEGMQTVPAVMPDASILPPIERATVQISTPTLAELRLSKGEIGEAAFRLTVLGVRGRLLGMSGHEVARFLQYALHPASWWNARRRAAWGWSLLAAVSAADLGVEITCQVWDGHSVKRVRLHERLAELHDAT